MRKVLIALLAVLAANAFALDHIWDMRYTLGPENRPSPKLGVGLGIRSDFNSDVLFPVNITSNLTKNFDVGAKVDVQTYNQFDTAGVSIDIGGRLRFKSAGFLEIDGYFGINRNSGSALIFTYGFNQFVAKNFMTSYEARVGFLDGVTGEDGYAKFQLGMTPTLIFGRLLQFLVEVNASSSAGNFTDDFMVDIIPKLELTLGGTRIRLDFDIGVMQEKNNDRKGIALYVMTSL